MTMTLNESPQLQLQNLLTELDNWRFDNTKRAFRQLEELLEQYQLQFETLRQEREYVFRHSRLLRSSLRYLQRQMQLAALTDTPKGKAAVLQEVHSRLASDAAELYGLCNTPLY